MGGSRRQVAVSVAGSRRGRSRVVVHPDAESLALAVATTFVGEARRAVKVRERFTVALSGGSTPRLAYTLLSRPPFADLVPWDRVEVFWSDERCVPRTDPLSNEGMARAALLDHVPVVPDRVHPVVFDDVLGALEDPGGAEGEHAARLCADRYEDLLRGFFGEGLGRSAPERRPAGFDLVLLGLGEDGHTASLFPGSPALGARGRWVAPASAPVSPGTRGRWRITLTPLCINLAAAVVFVAGGRAKAAVVQQVLRRPGPGARLPAQYVKPRAGTLHWYLDDDSAALLEEAEEKGVVT